MKRFLAIGLAVLLAVAAYAVVIHAARGYGFIELPEHRRGAFRFEVYKRNDDVRGALEYRVQTEKQTLAVIRVPHVMRADFGPHVAEFGGPGNLNDHPVMVQVRAFDGGHDAPDTFRIVARNRDGAIVYSAEGAVHGGNIEIRHFEGDDN